MATDGVEIPVVRRWARRWSIVSAAALLLVVASAPAVAHGRFGPSRLLTVLCTTHTMSGYAALGIDEQGSLVQFAVPRRVLPGSRVQLQTGARPASDRALAAKATSRVRVLGRAKEPLVVRSRLIEDGYERYGFYRNGHPLACRVTFDDAAAVSVTKLILSGRIATIRLGLRGGRLVHVAPREAPLTNRALAGRANTDVTSFVRSLTRGDSITSCGAMARDALLAHGGREGCIMAFESAKFIHRERYARASVERIMVFDLAGDTYALASIDRRTSSVRALFLHERGRYRYVGDLQLTRIELW